MPSAVLFLPPNIMLLTNFVTSRSWNFGSGRTSRRLTSPLRGMLDLLRPLGAVLRAPLLAVLHADRVERAADDVVAHTGQILHAAAADEHDRVLLQIVSDAWDVGGDLDAVGEAHARDLAQRRVGLLRRLQRRRTGLAPLLDATVLYELIGGRHRLLS